MCSIKYRLLLIGLVFVSCSSAPLFRSFYAGDGIYQHFVPATTWKAKDSEARLDITYRTGAEVDTPATVNISFIGRRATPQGVRSAVLHGAGVDCPLENIELLLVNDEKNEYRITSQADRDVLIALLKAEPFTLTAEVDGTVHTYTPHKHFIKLKNKLLDEAATP